jgi:hypothetical protein
MPLQHTANVHQLWLHLHTTYVSNNEVFEENFPLFDEMFTYRVSL